MDRSSVFFLADSQIIMWHKEFALDNKRFTNNVRSTVTNLSQLYVITWCNWSYLVYGFGLELLLLLQLFNCWTDEKWTVSLLLKLYIPLHGISDCNLFTQSDTNMCVLYTFGIKINNDKSICTKKVQYNKFKMSQGSFINGEWRVGDGFIYAKIF